MSMERFTLSVKETAQLLGIAPITLRRLIYTCQLPIVRVGRRVLIKKTDLEIFLTSGLYNNHFQKIDRELNDVKKRI